jgi:PAS domain S-box-containing protein
MTLIMIAVLLMGLLGAGGIFVLVEPLTEGILVKTGTLEKRGRDATAAMEHELKEYKRLDAAMASQAGRLDRANAALQESRERLQLALDVAQLGAWILDVNENTVAWDERMHAMFGIAPGSFSGRTDDFFNRVHPDDRSRVHDASAAARQGTGDFDLDYRIVMPDESIRYISSRALVVRDDHDQPKRMVGVCLDVTERQRAQEELAKHARELDRLNDELERSNQELQQFAYVASHDLQEPLRMVASYVQLLERRYKDQLDEQASEFIAFAVDGAKRMQTLINDLLDYSRVSTRGDALEPTDLSEPLTRALANVQARIEDFGAQVTHDPMPTVKADAGQLARLFQNLISNGLKFCKDRTPRVHIGAVREDGEWRFSVKDNGIGIEPQYADRVFVIFQRLHTRTEYEGTGIGLAVCKRIVDRHGGRIWFDSTPGEGTTFHFTIPDDAGEVH